jgi:hypothetical protein
MAATGTTISAIVVPVSSHAPLRSRPAHANGAATMSRIRSTITGPSTRATRS